MGAYSRATSSTNTASVVIACVRAGSERHRCASERGSRRSARRCSSWPSRPSCCPPPHPRGSPRRRRRRPSPRWPRASFTRARWSTPAPSRRPRAGRSAAGASRATARSATPTRTSSATTRRPHRQGRSTSAPAAPRRRSPRATTTRAPSSTTATCAAGATATRASSATPAGPTIGDNETPGSVGPVRLGEGRTATAITAGGNHTCALLDNGRVRCWGLGEYGQLGRGNHGVDRRRRAGGLRRSDRPRRPPRHRGHGRARSQLRDPRRRQRALLGPRRKRPARLRELVGGPQSRPTSTRSTSARDEPPRRSRRVRRTRA